MTNQHKGKYGFKPATSPSKPKKERKYKTGDYNRVKHDLKVYGGYGFWFSGEVRGLVKE